MAQVVLSLAEEGEIILEIAARGMPLVPIGMWESVIAGLTKRGLLEAKDAMNYVITAAGRAELARLQAASDDGLKTALARR